jgi:host factor-I protein
MKNSSESAVAKPATEAAPPEPQDEFIARKLIRPTRTDATGAAAAPAPAPERKERMSARRQMAPEQTHAENFYFQKQMQSHTQLTFVLRGGEQVQGTIEWYDKSCIKVNRGPRGSLLIYKQAIRYLYKSGE